MRCVNKRPLWWYHFYKRDTIAKRESSPSIIIICYISCQRENLFRCPFLWQWTTTSQYKRRLPKQKHQFHQEKPKHQFHQEKRNPPKKRNRLVLHDFVPVTIIINYFEKWYCMETTAVMLKSFFFLFSSIIQEWRFNWRWFSWRSLCSRPWGKCRSYGLEFPLTLCLIVVVKN